MRFFRVSKAAYGVFKFVVGCGVLGVGIALTILTPVTFSISGMLGIGLIVVGSAYASSGVNEMSKAYFKNYEAPKRNIPEKPDIVFYSRPPSPKRKILFPQKTHSAPLPFFGKKSKKDENKNSPSSVSPEEIFNQSPKK